MKTKRIYLFSASVLLSLALLTGCSTAATPKGSTENTVAVSKVAKNAVLSTFTGYVIDKHCFKLKPDPSKDSKKCLSMGSCEASGFGIAIKQPDGTYKFTDFDDKGQNLAKDIIRKTTKKDDISITAQGTQDGDVIKVTSISEQ